MKHSLRMLGAAVVLLSGAIPSAADIDNLWTGGGANDHWHNNSNWELGTPTTVMDAQIRSDRKIGQQEHVLIASGQTATCNDLYIGGPISDDPSTILPHTYLTIESDAQINFSAGDEAIWGAVKIGLPYNATCHNYGVIDGFAAWPHTPAGPNVMAPRVNVSYDSIATPDGGIVPGTGQGYLYCYDGSLIKCGAFIISRKPNCQGWVSVYEGASINAVHSVEIGWCGGEQGYGEFRLLGGTLTCQDTINAPHQRIPTPVYIGADGAFREHSVGLAYLDSGVASIAGDFVLFKGTTKIGKDLEFDVEGDYLIRPAGYQTLYGPAGQQSDPNDFLTAVEIDIDPATSVATSSTVVVGGDTHMDGHLVIENSGDRPKEGDQFTLIDGDVAQTHDGGFLSVTTNLVGGSAGYTVAGASGDWVATFTGLTGGDANGDHKVYIGDLSIMAGNWNQSGFTNGYGDADFNGDGNVGIGDLSIMAGNWGWELPGSSAVPEPATLSLLALAGLAVGRRRQATR